MGRMHAPGKGICTYVHKFRWSYPEICGLASSALPYRRAPPSWLKTTPEDVVDHIIKLARKGLTPSQIGVTLRDSHGIPQVRFVTGNKILRILKGQGKQMLWFQTLLVVPVSHIMFRIGPPDPGGPLASREKGRCRAQAPRDQPQRQGLEVPSHSHRVPYPPSCTLL